MRYGQNLVPDIFTGTSKYIFVFQGQRQIFPAEIFVFRPLWPYFDAHTARKRQIFVFAITLLRESSQAQPKHRCLRTALGRHYSRSFGSTRKSSREIRLARGCFFFPKRPLWPDPMTTTSPTQASCCFKTSHHNLCYSLEFSWSNLLRS